MGARNVVCCVMRIAMNTRNGYRHSANGRGGHRASMMLMRCWYRKRSVRDWQRRLSGRKGIGDEENVRENAHCLE